MQLRRNLLCGARLARRIAPRRGNARPCNAASNTEAEIEDWKSYYQIIDADTFQPKFYPLLLMCLNPSLEQAKFVLEFAQ